MVRGRFCLTLGVFAAAPLSMIPLLLKEKDPYVTGMKSEGIGEKMAVRNKTKTTSRRIVQSGTLLRRRQPDAIRAVSYSLYGSKPKYVQGMVEAARATPEIFPGWQVRVYHDASVPIDAMSNLSNLTNVKLINVTKDLPEWVGHINPSSWRFLIASDPSVGVYLIRDSDSRPSVRERAAVDEWLMSGKAFHIMRDNPAHHPHKVAPILGGCWGGLHSSVPNMEDLLREYYSTAREFEYGDDQDFLWQVVLPIAWNMSLQHDSYSCIESGGIAFPLTREEVGDLDDFIGKPHFINLPAGAKVNDPRMHQALNMAKEKDCIFIRQAIKEQFDRANKTFPPDTVYKGKLNGSSVELIDRNKGKAR